MPSELPPPAGFSDILAPTFNQSTGKTRSWACADPDGNVVLQTSSNAPIQSSTVTLTAAQIIALGTTPIQIVAGVTGSYLSLVQVILEYLAGSTPFTTTSGGLIIGNGTNPGGVGNNYVNSASGFLDQTASTVIDSTGSMAGNTPNPSSQLTGLNINISGNDGWNVTAGNGTLKVTIYYVSFAL